LNIKGIAVISANSNNVDNKGCDVFAYHMNNAVGSQNNMVRAV